jgi:hypothetical protein
VRLIIRVAIGVTLAAGGLTFLTYGIAQAIENGSCGTSSEGVSYGPPCPSGTGPMILLMVFGTFFAVGGAALAGVLLRFIGVIIVSVVAGVVFGIVDLNPDDTRPGYEVIIAVVAPMALFALPGIGRPRRTARIITPEIAAQYAQPQSPPPAPPGASFGTPPQWQPRQPATPAQAEDVASRLRQLDQLKDSGLLGEDEYAERRKQILAEL